MEITVTVTIFRFSAPTVGNDLQSDCKPWNIVPLEHLKTNEKSIEFQVVYLIAL